MSLQNKTAVVTGSDGYRACHCPQAGESRARVAIGGRRADKLRDATAGVTGNQIVWRVCDVSDRTARANSSAGRLKNWDQSISSSTRPGPTSRIAAWPRCGPSSGTSCWPSMPRSPTTASPRCCRRCGSGRTASSSISRRSADWRIAPGRRCLLRLEICHGGTGHCRLA